MKCPGRHPEAILVALLLIPALPGLAGAANILWKSPVNGSWSTASNWNPPQVPGPSDVAIISLTGTYTVTIGSSVTVGAIALSGGTGTRRLTATSATVTTSTGITVGSTNILTLNSSTLSGTGTLDLDGQLISTGTSYVNVPVATHATSTISVSADALHMAGSLDNFGVLEFYGGGEPSLFVNGTLVNHLNATIRSLVPGVTPYDFYARLIGSLDNRGALVLEGNLTLSSPTASHTNSGTIAVNAGELSVVLDPSCCREFTTSGNITLNGRLYIYGGAALTTQRFVQTAGTISGPGFLLFARCTALIQSSVTCGYLSADGANVTFSNGIVLSSTGTHQFDSYLSEIAAPSLTIEADQIFLMTGSNTWVIPVITNYGYVRVQGLERTPGSAWINQPGATVEVIALLLDVGSFDNHGEVRLTSPQFGTFPMDSELHVDGWFRNEPGALFSVTAYGPGTRILRAQLENQGSVILGHPLTVASDTDLQHVNSGTIDAGGADLTIQMTGTASTFTNSGSIDLDPIRTLAVHGGSFQSTGSVIGGGMLLLADGVTSSFGVTPAITSLTMNDATATIPGTLNTSLTGIDLTNSDLATYVLNAPGRTVSVVASTIQGTVENLGTLDIRGASNLLAHLVNTGLVTIQDGVVLSSGDTGHQNQGVIRVLGGTFAINQTPAGWFSNQDTLKVFPGAVCQVSDGQFTNEITGVLAGSGVLDMSTTTFINNGTINPGASPGMMTIDGDVTMGSTSVLNMEIGGPDPGSGYDQIVVDGTVVLDGVMNLSTVNGFAPSPGQTFDLLLCTTHTGGFAQVNGADVGGGSVLSLFPAPGTADPIRLSAIGQTWSPLAAGGSPGERTHHAAAYDRATNRLIVFGGLGAAGELNDTWVLTNANGIGGPAAWQLLPTSSPPPARQGHASAYDAANNRLIVFGGVSSSAPGGMSDVWLLTHANGLGGTPVWTQLTPGGGTPGPRVGSGVAYSARSRSLVLFGGVDPVDPCTNASDDVWILSNANGLGGVPNWSLLATSGLPPYPRSGAVLTYDEAANRLLVQGGADACAGVLAEARALSHADGTGGAPEWSTLALNDPVPPDRKDHAGFYDVFTDRLVMFGGLAADGVTLVSDALVVSGAANPDSASWGVLPMPETHPSARSGHSVSWDPTSRRMIVFGGNTAEGLQADVWTLQLDFGSGEVSGVADPEASAGAPRLAFLGEPRPNPTPGPVLITFSLPAGARASVDVFDVSGRRVANLFDGVASEGPHEIRWTGRGDGGPIPSGVYFIRVSSGQNRDVRRIVVN